MFAIGFFLLAFFMVVAGVLKNDAPYWVMFVGVVSMGVGIALMLASVFAVLWRVLP